MELKHNKADATNNGLIVLIVPYGIETRYRRLVPDLINCVNCTLWN